MPGRSIALGLTLAAAVGGAAASDQIAKQPKALTPQEIERSLADLGLDPGQVDGVFDAKTEQALRAFQKKAGVAVTGKIDDATMAELIASGEAKMLHSLPKALLPANTAPENFGTKVILRPVDRKGAMLLVIPRRGGYQHKLQFLGLTKDGRAHVESTVWSNGAVHEIDEPLMLAGYAFTPDSGQVMVFRVDRKKGYVFVSGSGTVKPPQGPVERFGPQQRGRLLGEPPLVMLKKK